MAKDLAAEDQVLHVPFESVRTYGDERVPTVVGPNTTFKNPYRQGRQYQAVRDRMDGIAKLAANTNLPVNTRIERLAQLAKKYADGSPFKNNAKFSALHVDGVPVLSRLAQGAADQLLSVAKQQAAGSRDNDKGKMGNQ